jgi:hypothetical protein
MTFEEALCWAFDTVPSQLKALGWKLTLHDFLTRLRLRVAETQVSHVQQFQVFMETVSAAFGKSDGDSSTNKTITTNDAAIAALTSLGRG